MNIIDFLYLLSPFYIGSVLFISSEAKLLFLLKSFIFLKIVINLFNNHFITKPLQRLEYILFCILVIVLCLYMYINHIPFGIYNILLLIVSLIFLYLSFFKKNKFYDILWHVFITIFMLYSMFPIIEGF